MSGHRTTYKFLWDGLDDSVLIWYLDAGQLFIVESFWFLHVYVFLLNYLDDALSFDVLNFDD